jgi:hypothetical protein
MPIQVLNGPNIAPGEALSDALDCSAGPIVKITMPADWTDAVLTFQTSSDNVGYNDIFQPDGSEVVWHVRAGAAIIGQLLTGWVKFRSGTSERPVPQPGIRTFAVAIDTAPTLRN